MCSQYVEKLQKPHWDWSLQYIIIKNSKTW